MLAAIRSHRVDREHFAPFIQRSWAANDPVTRVLAGEGEPYAGSIARTARAIDPATRTDTAGRFVLRGVDANQALFLRVSKAGHATTNTPYLNPRGPKENLRILLLTDAELQSVKSDAAPHALPPTGARSGWPGSE